MDDYLKTDMTEFGLTLKSINPSAEWIAIPPEVKWVDADCSMNQLSALKYVEVQDVQVLLSIMYPPKKILITDSSRFWNVDVLGALGRESIHEIEIRNNKYYTSEDGIVYTKDKKKLLKCPPERTGHIVIPDGVREIGERAFANSKVESITFPDSLREIGYEAFVHCTKLNQIDFGRGIKEIGKTAFEWCSVLTVLKLPPQIKKICEYAFKNCINLKKVILNDGLKMISYGAFDTHSANMESVKLPKSLKHLGSDNFDTAKSIILEVQFSDDPKVLDSRMTIKKLSAKGNPISGTIFKVEYIDDFNGNSDNVKRTWYLQSDANGIVRFDDNHVVTSLTQYRSDEFFKFNNNIVLPYYGQLRFTEVSTPASYVLNSEPFVVNLADAQNGSTVDLSKTVYNDLEPAKVQLTKYKDDGSPLAGVEFELKFVKESETATKNKSESFSRLLNVGETATATTDADGKITWENLDQGDYEIRETKTVDGCALLTDVIKVTLPLQLTKDEADSYGNVNKDLAKEDTNYTKKWYFFDCKYEIKNNQVFLMPMTGSDGTWMYGFVGFAAIAFTGCLYLLLDEKKKNKRKHRRKRR